MTKQHVLQQNPLIPASNVNEFSSDPKFWSSNFSGVSQTHLKSRTSVSLPRRPLQENLTKLDRILNDLDEIDGYAGGYESQGLLNMYFCS